MEREIHFTVEHILINILHVEYKYSTHKGPHSKVHKELDCNF